MQGSFQGENALARNEVRAKKREETQGSTPRSPPGGGQRELSRGKRPHLDLWIEDLGQMVVRFAVILSQVLREQMASGVQGFRSRPGGKAQRGHGGGDAACQIKLLSMPHRVVGSREVGDGREREGKG
eukprot:311116-Pelagomonas_calceolata.AAC.2